MAQDYSKPGKTAPGTVHARPERGERKTWLDIVKPAPGYAPKEQEKLPTTVSFTRPTTPSNLGTTRRERRAAARAEGEDAGANFEVVDAPFAKVAAGARKSRRIAKANRDRRQRVGQRAFTRRQLAAARDQDTIAKLVEIADGKTEVSPIVVANATFGLQRRMEAMQG